MELNKERDLRVKTSSTIDHGSRIKPSTLTKEQEAQIISKIIMQMEKNKEKEAKKRNSEGPITVSIKTINNDLLLYNGENNNYNKFRTRQVRDLRKPHAPHNWQGNNGGGKHNGDNPSTRNSSNFFPQKGWVTLPLRDELAPGNPDLHQKKNYFDQQIEPAKEKRKKVDNPTVLADPDTTHERCLVCHDQFDECFHEEKEERHLKNAITVNNEPYHPTWFEDYNNPLIELDESRRDTSVEKEIPDSVIVNDDEHDSDFHINKSVESETVESLKTEESKKLTEEPKQGREEFLEDEKDDDVIINEITPVLIFIDDDDDEDILPNNNSHVEIKKIDNGVIGLINIGNENRVKIKDEPSD